MDWWKKKKNSRAVIEKERLVRELERGAILLEELIECCNGKSNPIKFFSADQILKATDTFSDSNRVSELYDDFPFDWYSGKENDNHHMIKKWRNRLNDNNRGNFCRDIAISSMFRSKIGIVVEKENEDSRGDCDCVSLSTHCLPERPFVYRIMRLREILLDEDGVAKLCNFSHCVSIPQGETFVKLGFRCVGGDYDYMDDDYLINGLVSEKTDAYGFGIFMQKLLTGEERFRELYGRNESKFPNWLSKSYEDGSIDEIVDSKMLEEMVEVSLEDRCRMEAFLLLSERCIGFRGEVPNMVQVAKELKRFLKDYFSSSGETQNQT